MRNPGFHRSLALGAAFTLVLTGLPACGDDDAAPRETTDDVIGDVATADDLSEDDAAPGDAAPEDAALPDTAPEDVSDAMGNVDGTSDAAEVSDDTSTPDAAEDTVADIVEPPAPWRSRLYPESWTPAYTAEDGRFLHDFSYAGYRSGEVPLPDVDALPLLSIADHGAPTDGSADAAPALRAVLEVAALHATPETPVVVHLPAGLYRFDTPVTVSTAGVILRGDGPDRTRLHFASSASRNHAASLTFAGTVRFGTDLPLRADGVARETEVRVADASSLSPGDEVAVGWVVSAEFIADHQMQAFWRAFNDTWQPMFRRRVVAVDTSETPHRVTLDIPLRYPAKVRDGASLRVETGLLAECGLAHVGIANAVGWDEAWSRNQVHAVAFDGVKDCFAVDVRSFPSPSAPTLGRGVGAHLQSSGLLVRGSRRVTIADGAIGPTQNRGSGGNGYLYEVRQSGEILFRDLEARGGRHNFIQNWGFGVTGVVWLRTRSLEGRAFQSSDLSIGTTGFSEFHHSLATANLIDDSFAADGWSASNRRDESTGAGHTATENVFWNISGPGILRSYQHGMGYVIGTAPETNVAALEPDLDPELAEALYPLSSWYLSEPWDHVEGEGLGAALEPRSLYEDQLQRRLGSR